MLPTFYAQKSATDHRVHEGFYYFHNVGVGHLQSDKLLREVLQTNLGTKTTSIIRLHHVILRDILRSFQLNLDLFLIKNTYKGRFHKGTLKNNLTLNQDSLC